MLGKTSWVIPEGYLPAAGPYPDNPTLRSHETARLLNANAQAAHVRIEIYFSDRDPAGPYHVTVAPRRTLHLRFDELEDP